MCIVNSGEKMPVKIIFSVVQNAAKQLDFTLLFFFYQKVTISLGMLFTQDNFGICKIKAKNVL